jgi:Flp pilus assembly pilin Flp
MVNGGDMNEGAPGCSAERRTTVAKLTADTRGLTTVEYAIVGALVAVVSIAGWNALGQSVAAKADGAAAALGGAAPQAGSGSGNGWSSSSGSGTALGGGAFAPGNTRPTPDRAAEIVDTSRKPFGR